MAHAYERIPVQKIEDQGGMIHKTLDVLEAFTDERPVGWLGLGLTQTLETPDLLAEAGLRYIADRVYDDEPDPDLRLTRCSDHAVLHRRA